MSSIVNKVKEALHSDKSDKHSDSHATHSDTTHGTHGTHTATTGNTTTTTAGPHSSNIANKADPRVDSDLDNRGTHGNTLGSTTGTHGSHTTHGTTTGSGFGSNTGNTSTTAGPHSSNLANKVDPRVDSDLDGSRTAGGNAYGSNTGTTGGLTSTHGTHTTHGTTGTSTGYGSTTGNTSTTAGPHSSNLANKIDPRVDSDLDGSRTAGGNAYGSNTGTTGGLTGTHGTHTTHGTTGPSSGFGSTGTTTAGPHSSNLANKADPRVDSDFDGSRTAGGNTYGSNTGTTGVLTGTHGHNATHTQGSGIGNTTYGQGASTGGALSGTHATGPAPNTAGPHKSDMMNKVDPRVDSNLDGSKTMGGDKTFQQSEYAGKDPTDAAQVPPSVLAKHIGGAQVHHDDIQHDREQRHSISHQEQHRGL